MTNKQRKQFERADLRTAQQTLRRLSEKRSQPEVQPREKSLLHSGNIAKRKKKLRDLLRDEDEHEEADDPRKRRDVVLS